MLKKNFGMILILSAMAAASANAAVEVSRKDALKSAFPASGKLRHTSEHRRAIETKIKNGAKRASELLGTTNNKTTAFLKDKILVPVTAKLEQAAITTNAYAHNPKFSLPTFGLEHLFQKSIFNKAANPSAQSTTVTIAEDLRTGPKAISTNGRKYFGPQIKAIQSEYNVGAPTEFKFVSVQIGESNFKEEVVQATFQRRTQVEGSPAQTEEVSFLIMANSQAKDISALAKKAGKLSKYSFAATTELNANVKVEATEAAAPAAPASVNDGNALADAPAPAVDAPAPAPVAKLTISQKITARWEKLTSPFRNLAQKASNFWAGTVKRYNTAKAAIGSFIDVNYQRAARLLTKITLRSKKAEVAKAEGDATTTPPAVTTHDETGSATVAAAPAADAPAVEAPKEVAPAAPAALEAPKGVVMKDASGASVPNLEYIETNFKNARYEAQVMAGLSDAELAQAFKVVKIGNQPGKEKEFVFIKVQDGTGTNRYFVFGDAETTFTTDFKSLNSGAKEPAGFLDEMNTSPLTWAKSGKFSKLLNKLSAK